MRLLARLIPVLLLAAMGTLLWKSAAGESQTYDEAIHLSAGYSYWATGGFKLNPEHPPLSKLLQAAPLLATDAALPMNSDAWARGDAPEIGRLFVHHNRVPAATLLMLGRSVTIVLTLVLGLVIFLWTRSEAGVLAGSIALGLFALDPNFIAHGHYITSDVPVSLAIFAAAITWLRYVKNSTNHNLWLAATVLGLALATKFNALYLLPLHIGIAATSRRNGRRGGSAGLGHLLTAALIAIGVIAACYGPANAQAFLANPRKPLATLRDHHPYALGVKALTDHNDYRQPAYLLGEKYRGGKWQFFPVAFLVKTPTAGLLAILILLFTPGVWRRYLPLLAYPAAYFAIAMVADINLGVRHILPVYPFLYALAGMALGTAIDQRRSISIKNANRTYPSTFSRLHPGPVLVTLLAAIGIFETARIHPDHIAFFNLFAGGPDNGPTLLLDSNLDWGQDLLKLKSFLASQGTDTVSIAYFGGAEPADYGIRALGLPGVWDTAEIAKLNGWAAISMTELHDVYFDKPTYTWLLRDRKPTARIGRSILVYDLRKPLR